MTGEDVLVVIPVLNGRDYICQCIDAVQVALQQVGGGEIVVVDNGSTDGTCRLVQECYEGRVLLTSGVGLTVGGLRNVGAGLGTGEILSFVDADCIVAPDYYQNALLTLRAGRHATGSRYALPERPRWVEDVWHRLHERRQDGPVNYLNSGNFLCKRGVFESVGGFDADLESGEDAELGARLRSRGFVIWEAQAVRAVHLGNPKSALQFFRKQMWHGMGALGTFHQERLDRPFLMTLMHVLAVALGVLLIVVEPAGWSVGVLIGGSWLVPLASVAYRLRTAGTSASVLRATLLYQLYFSARAVALLMPRRRPSPGPVLRPECEGDSVHSAHRARIPNPN